MDGMHKGIRSENVIFPGICEERLAAQRKGRPISLCHTLGFEYSHQDTEAVTIDKGKHLGDIQAAIYRHPDYQGEATSGHTMKYYIYSFGLVLVEIALWTPLLAFLAAKEPKLPTSIHLSSTMTSFHREEALELKNRVLGKVKVEMGFREGSRFRDVVQWQGGG